MLPLTSLNGCLTTSRRLRKGLPLSGDDAATCRPHMHSPVVAIEPIAFCFVENSEPAELAGCEFSLIPPSTHGYVLLSSNDKSSSEGLTGAMEDAGRYPHLRTSLRLLGTGQAQACRKELPLHGLWCRYCPPGHTVLSTLPALLNINPTCPQRVQLGLYIPKQTEAYRGLNTPQTKMDSRV